MHQALTEMGRPCRWFSWKLLDKARGSIDYSLVVLSRSYLRVTIMRSSSPFSVALVAAAILSGCGDREPVMRAENAGVAPEPKAVVDERPAVDWDDLETRDGVMVDAEEKPFRGVVEARSSFGAMRMKMEVREGRPDSLLRIWDAAGVKRVQARYSKGKLASVRGWDAAGKEIAHDPANLSGFESLENPLETLGGEDREGDSLVDRLMPGFGYYPGDDNRWSSAPPPVPETGEEKVVTAHPWELNERGGRLYWSETNEPFTGKVSAEYDDHSSYERFYEDGRPHGRSTSYFASGQRRLEEHYVEGRKEGPFTAWHENGQRKFQTSVRDGRQLGISQHWNADGEVIARWNYTADGQIVNAMTPASVTADPE